MIWSTVAPLAAAIAERVSPACTVYVFLAALGDAPGVLAAAAAVVVAVAALAVRVGFEPGRVGVAVAPVAEVAVARVRELSALLLLSGGRINRKTATNEATTSATTEPR